MREIPVNNLVEISFHILFWCIIAFTININWTHDWFDASMRPRTPAPLLLLVFGLYFYLNAFVLIPRFFSLENWKKYILFATALFFIPEIIRIFLYSQFISGTYPKGPRQL